MSYIPWSVCLSLLGIPVGANVKCVFLLNSQAWGETANRRCDKKLHRLLCYATRTHYFSSDTCCGSLPQRSGFFYICVICCDVAHCFFLSSMFEALGSQFSDARPTKSRLRRCDTTEVNRTHTYTHPFNGPLLRTTSVSWILLKQ